MYLVIRRAPVCYLVAVPPLQALKCVEQEQQPGGGGGGGLVWLNKRFKGEPAQHFTASKMTQQKHVITPQ